jgi:hypothetical protein
MRQIRGKPVAGRTVLHQSPRIASGIDVSPRLAGGSQHRSPLRWPLSARCPPTAR